MLRRRKMAAVAIIVASFAGSALAGQAAGSEAGLPSGLDSLHAAQFRTTNCGADCPPPQSPFTCSDSDGGLNPGVQGTVTIYYQGSFYYSYTDYCSNSGTLVEYWCNSPQSWTSTTFYCSNGCSAGACL